MLKHQDKGPAEIISCKLCIKGSLAKFEYPYFDYVSTLFYKYKENGMLPFPGSLSEQPAKIIEIFEVLSQLDFERQQKLVKEQQREQARLNRNKGRK